MHSLVQSRIGSDIFISRVQRLRESKAFNHNERVVLVEGEYLFDSTFQEFIRSNLGTYSHLIQILLLKL